MLTTLLMAGTAMAAHDGITMKFVASGAVERAGNYMPVRSQMTDQASYINKAPAGMTNPRYGTIKIADHSFAFVLDEAAGQLGKLYVDTNGDGDLTNDPATSWNMKEREGS